MSDERTPQEIDDQLMDSLLSLTYWLVNCGVDRAEFQETLDVIKDGVAELVARVEAADNQRFYDDGGESV